MSTKKELKLDPKKTVIAVDLHGVLFKHDYKKMLKLFWDSKNKLQLFRAIISPSLWLDLLKLKKKGAVIEQYLVLLADKHVRLKPFVPLGIAIANAQKPINPVIDILLKLKNKGYKLELFSNIGETIFKNLQKKTPKVFTLFDSFTISSKSNDYRRKPNADAFQAFLKSHNTKNKTVILIDDKQKNTCGAQKNGIIGLLFTSAKQMEKELQRLGVLR